MEQTLNRLDHHDGPRREDQQTIDQRNHLVGAPVGPQTRSSSMRSSSVIQQESSTLPSRLEEQRLAAMDDPGDFQQRMRVRQAPSLPPP